MLFAGLPVSSNSFKLTVITLLIGGGFGEAVSGVCALAAAVFGDTGLFCAGELPALGFPAVKPVAELSCPGALAPEIGTTSSRLIAGGSEESLSAGWSGRVTITVSPASLAIPPASASASTRVMGRSA